LEDKEEMTEIIREEREGEATCTWIKVKNQPNERNNWIRGVVTRSGKKVEDKQDSAHEDTEGGESLVGTNTTEETHSKGSGDKAKKKVPFSEETDAAGNLIIPLEPKPKDHPRDNQDIRGGMATSPLVSS
jgi:hypothetical protein